MKKVVASAGSNVALLKYWGRNNEVLRLPINNSISIGLEDLTTTVSILESEQDEVYFEGKSKPEQEIRIFKFLDMATNKKREKVRIEIVNSYPFATGLSSSASVFGALAKALDKYYLLGLDERGLSRLARKGSGSAARSIHGGIVRWNAGNSDESSYSEQLYDPEYWDLSILAVAVDDSVKKVPTSSGHQLARTSPYFEARLKIIKHRERELLEAINDKDFEKLAVVSEREMMEFHAILMTSDPSLFYWYPATVELIHQIRKMRGDGVPVFSTVNTGHNVFVFTLPKYLQEIKEQISAMEMVENVIESRIGGAARIVENK